MVTDFPYILKWKENKFRAPRSGAQASNMPQMFWSISKPRRKNRTTPGTFPINLLWSFPSFPSFSRFSARSWCSFICCKKWICKLLGIESRNRKAHWLMEASMKVANSGKSGSASNSKPRSSKLDMWSCRSCANTLMIHLAAASLSSWLRRLTIPWCFHWGWRL